VFSPGHELCEHEIMNLEVPPDCGSVPLTEPRKLDLLQSALPTGRGMNGLLDVELLRAKKRRRRFWERAQNRLASDNHDLVVNDACGRPDDMVELLAVHLSRGFRRPR
jgi:hypothetical protein